MSERVSNLFFWVFVVVGDEDDERMMKMNVNKINILGLLLWEDEDDEKKLKI